MQWKTLKFPLLLKSQRMDSLEKALIQWMMVYVIQLSDIRGVIGS